MEVFKPSNRISKKPKLYYYRKFPKKLRKKKDSITDLKLHYKKKITPLKLNYELPLEHDLDSKWNPIVRALEDLFDVLITPHEYIDSAQKVRKTVAIVGPRETIIPATDLFNETYYTFFGSVERKTRAVRLLHRQARRKARRGTEEQKGFPDARLKISSYKSRLLGFIEVEIRKLIAEIEADPKIKIRGFKRRKRIKDYIWGKYKKKWKTRL